MQRSSGVCVFFLAGMIYFAGMAEIHFFCQYFQRNDGTSPSTDTETRVYRHNKEKKITAVKCFLVHETPCLRRTACPGTGSMLTLSVVVQYIVGPRV